MPADLVPLTAGPLLEPLCRAGVLTAADVHLARLLCRTCGERDERVVLALALTCRELRRGSVHLDPRTIAADVLRDLVDPAFLESADPAVRSAVDAVEAMTWPDPDDWLASLAASPAVADLASPVNTLPARLDDDLLHLERYWQAEDVVARRLAELAADPPRTDPVEAVALVRDALAGSHTLLDEAQFDAARAAASHRVSVLAGGPGTGKTTTVCAILAVLRAADPHLGRIALAAPSGKAAARLRDAVAEVSQRMPADLVPPTAETMTVHSLLGWHGPGRGFTFDRLDPLPYGVIVVDEASMLSLPLTASLLDAVGPATRVLLVGDPGQLVSVDAGSVLADIVASADLLGHTDRGEPRLPVTTLTRNHRSGGGIADLAEAVRRGLPDDALAVLSENPETITFIDADPAMTPLDTIPEVLATVRRTAMTVRDHAAAGRDDEALAGVDAHRLLCAHRLGPYGVAEWSGQMIAALSDVMPGLGRGRWVLGEPTMATHNMRQLQVSNGDCGVVVETTPVPTVALPGPGGTSRRLPCSLVQTLQPLQAMTVHKAQGSQFDDVTVVLPPPDSALLTRELLYTALTRARRHLTVVGTRESVTRAVLQPTRRHSGLARRWRRQIDS